MSEYNNGDYTMLNAIANGARVKREERTIHQNEREDIVLAIERVKIDIRVNVESQSMYARYMRELTKIQNMIDPPQAGA